MYDVLNDSVLQKISEIADAEGVQAFVIGGFVRDIFLRRHNNDIDIVTLGNGIDLAEKTAHAISPKLTVSVFKNFGTAMFRYNGMEYEFVGARKESYSHDSRKPHVEAGTLEEDQNRRDFTINALALSLNKENFAELLDPFNGLQDMNDKIIRTPLDPALTFSDDPLRMMRAVRFAAQLDFTIEEKTFEGIRQMKERISIVSMERIIDEFNKIMMTEKPSRGIVLLDKAGLLELIFPELSKLKGVEVINGCGHKDNFLHTLQVLDNVAEKSDNLWLRWTALLHDIGKPRTKKFSETIGWTFYGHEIVGSRMVPDIFRRLKLPMNEKLKYVQKLVLLHLRPIALVDEEVSDSAVRRLLFDASDDIDDLMLLCEADITSKNEIKVKTFLQNFQLVREKLKIVEEKDALRNWQPPITGEEIIETFHIQPSKEVGIIKLAIREAILDGVIGNNHDEAFAFMLEKGKELGLAK
ncbi:MAG: HD domain-containing protein [Bacteroidales bacterium]|nr:HD domain-containing protein [Bacteroidales bacterium]